MIFTRNDYMPRNIVIPEGFTEIGEDAFYGCTDLKSVTIPEGVTEIGYRAFYECDSLESINLPDSLEVIGERAFVGCPDHIQEQVKEWRKRSKK